MPSFDVVSEVNKHELANAIDQTNREITNRFDFKGSDSRVEQQDNVLTLDSQSQFQVEQILDILRTKLVKRGIDLLCLELGEVKEVGSRAKMEVTVREGLDQDLARKIVKLIKDKKLKVQAAIQGEQVRVTGKKRDDLQTVISMLKGADLGLPLQYNNFRD